MPPPFLLARHLEQTLVGILVFQLKRQPILVPHGWVEDLFRPNQDILSGALLAQRVQVWSLLAVLFRGLCFQLRRGNLESWLELKLEDVSMQQLFALRLASLFAVAVGNGFVLSLDDVRVISNWKLLPLRFQKLLREGKPSAASVVDALSETGEAPVLLLDRSGHLPQHFASLRVPKLHAVSLVGRPVLDFTGPGAQDGEVESAAEVCEDVELDEEVSEELEGAPGQEEASEDMEVEGVEIDIQALPCAAWIPHHLRALLQRAREHLALDETPRFCLEARRHWRRPDVDAPPFAVQVLFLSEAGQRRAAVRENLAKMERGVRDVEVRWQAQGRQHDTRHADMLDATLDVSGALRQAVESLDFRRWGATAQCPELQHQMDAAHKLIAQGEHHMAVLQSVEAEPSGQTRSGGRGRGRRVNRQPERVRGRRVKRS